METHSEGNIQELFIQQIMEKETKLTVLVTGSFVEIDQADYRDNPSDIDLMICMTNIIGVSIQNQKLAAIVSGSFNGRLIKHTLHHPECHPGFTKIESQDHDYFRSYFSTDTIAVKGTGPAMKVGKVLQHPASLFGFQKGIDIVSCIPCEGWPETASAWINRHRASGWPSNDLVERVVSDGYHLVDKPHPRHAGKEKFWRISFSKSECLLMNNFNQVQRRVYVLLREIKMLTAEECRREEDSVLSTYFFKTAMLWMCEEKPTEFWENTNISVAIVEILAKIISWLIDRNCPNYFIPENNMLDHLADDFDLGREIRSLTQLAESDWSEVEMRLLIMKEKEAHCFSFCSMHAQMLVVREIVKPLGVEIILPFVDSAKRKRVLTFDDSYKLDDLLKIFKPKSFDYQIIFKLYEVLGQRDLSRNQNSAESKLPVCPATDFLCLDRSKHEDIDLLKLISSGLRPVPETVWKSVSRSEAINLALTGFRQKTISGTLRPVFMVCAYLANYYWAVEKDYASAMLVSQTVVCACSDGLADPNGIRQMTDASLNKTSTSLVYNMISEISYPVLLSSRWSKFFDDNVRTVHGFLVLCNAFDHETKHLAIVAGADSTIKFCAVLFLHYIKVQLELKHGDDAKIKSAVQGFLLHEQHICPSDGHNWTCAGVPSQGILLAMLRSSLAASNQLRVLAKRSRRASKRHQTSGESNGTDQSFAKNSGQCFTVTAKSQGTNVIEQLLQEMSMACQFNHKLGSMIDTA